MVTNELIEYIKTQRGLGKSDIDIRQSLLISGGWTESDIDQAFGVPKSKNFAKPAGIIVLVLILLGGGAYAYYVWNQQTIPSNSHVSSVVTTNNQNTVLPDSNSTVPPTSDSNTTSNPTTPVSQPKSTAITTQPSSLPTNGNSNIVVIVPQPDLIRLCPVCDLNLSVAVGEVSTTIQDTNSKFVSLLNMNVQGSIYDSGQYPQKLIKTIPMSDNIINGNGHPNDGIYVSESVKGLSAGTYSVFYTVKGTDAQGHTVDKKSSPSGEITNVDVSTGNAQILKIEDEGLDIIGDGTSGVIQTSFLLSAKKQGAYILSATFISPNGQEIPISGHFSLFGGGQAEGKNLLLDSRDNGSKMTNGVYKIKDIYLFENINNETVWVDTWDGIYTTKSYKVK